MQPEDISRLEAIARAATQVTWIVGDAKHRDPGCIVIHTQDGESIASAWSLWRADGSDPSTPMEANAEHIVAFQPRVMLQLCATLRRLQAAAHAALDHVQELREAWHTGVLTEQTWCGGTRSNRNVDVEVMLREDLEPTKETTKL